MTAEARILVDGVSKRYVKYDDAPMLVSRALRYRSRTTRNDLWALRDASFEVAPGETIGVIGQNGSGKSTLLRLLAGVTAPTRGRVAVRGRIAPLISVGVGFHQELTGRENVYVSGIVLGLSRSAIDDRFDDIVAFAEIGDFIDTPVKFYSSGMFVRLGFAVSVLAQPDVLLVDEVLAVGDLAFQLRCFERMAELRAAGTTIVVVSHNLSAIRRMCDRTLVVHHGELRHDGDTSEAIALFHDLLGEQRDIEGDAVVDPIAVGVGDLTGAGRIERFELLGADGVATGHVRSGDRVTFVLQAAFDRPVDDAIAGIVLYNAAGIVVYTLNSSLVDVLAVAEGDRVTVSATLTCRLTTGSYQGEVVLRSQRGATLVTPAKPVAFYVAGPDDVHGIADLDGHLEVAIGADADRR